MDYKKNLKYFSETHIKLPLALIGVGAILFLVGLDGLVGAIILGLLLMAGGIATLVLQFKGKMSDQDYDKSVFSAMNGINQRALNKLGLDADEVKEIAPITFGGYATRGFNYAKRGKDNRWRTNKFETTTLFFSDSEVHCYSYSFSTTEDKKTETTDVYFYKDIVSVTTASEAIKYPGAAKETECEYFKLTTAGGNALTVTLSDVEGAQRSINAMRQLLKQKKMA